MIRRLIPILLLFCFLHSTARAEMDLLSKGDAYLADGDAERAFTAYSLAMQSEPDSTEVMLHVARVYRGGGETEKSLELVNRALLIDPVCGDAYLLRMLITMQSDPLSAYLDALRAEVLDSAPSGAEYAGLGVALFKVGGVKEALAMFSLAGDEALSDGVKQYYAFALYADGQTEKADETLAKRPSANLSIAAVAESESPLILREIDFFDASGAYKLIAPAHCVRPANGALDGPLAMMREMGAASESDGSCAVTLDGEALASFMRDCQLISVSPDGNTMLLKDKTPSWYALRGDIILLLSQTPDRGVHDEYSNLKTALSTHSFGNSPGSVVWSHDGRYFTVTDTEASLMRVQFFIDLFIFDTVTGEVFLGATYPNNALAGGSTVIQTGFEETDGSIYYILYGGQYENIVALMNYDMATGKTALCYNGEELTAFPKLCFDSAHRLISITDNTRVSALSGLNVYSQTTDGWVNAPVESNAPFGLGYPKWMDYSSNTDYGLMLRFNSQTYAPYSMLSVFTALDDYAGVGKYVSIGGFDAPEATLEDITEENPRRNIVQIPGRDGDSPVYAYDGIQVVNAQLAPDGRYALLLAADGGEHRLLLLNLETLSLRPVECDIDAHASFGGAASRQYPQGISWSHGTSLIVNTSKGPRFMELCERE